MEYEDSVIIIGALETVVYIGDVSAIIIGAFETVSETLTKGLENIVMIISTLEKSRKSLPKKLRDCQSDFGM